MAYLDHGAGSRVQEMLVMMFTLGVTLMVLLFYGPIVLIVLFSFISFTVIAIIVCRRATKLKGRNRKKANHVIREMILIVSYPVIYNILCVLLLANRIKEAINSDKQEPPFFPTVDGGSCC